MPSRFTEHDTETYYDAEDDVYRSFWDSAGSLHWGVFDERTGDDFLKACANANDIMVREALIDKNSRVLDLGCGNGTTATWLCRSQGCRVTGIDLSGVRVDNANEALRTQSDEVQNRLVFKKASGTELPFHVGEFSHVWSQATFYHIHDKEAALREAYRVLEPGGKLVFDDLIKPKPDISPEARQYVYDRLLFDTDYTFESYQVALRSLGFSVLRAQDLSRHLQQSYSCLSKIVVSHDRGHEEKYQALSYAYDQSVQAVERHELGWALYICQK